MFKPAASAACGLLLLAFGLTAPKPAAQTAALGGLPRYAAFVSTDRAIYRAGDTVYARAVVLDTQHHTPWPQQINARAALKGPQGNVVTEGWVDGSDGTVGFGWPVPEGQAGGAYTLELSFPHEGFPMAARSFDVRNYNVPRLNQQITFKRDGYGPGDTVSATLHSERAEGGIPQGAKVHVLARVDGAEVYHGVAQVDAQGNASCSFALPKHMARGEGTLAMATEDGGVVETEGKTLPILLQTLDLTLYPEGGDPVAGLPTRVYLEAHTPAKKPADVRAVIVDDAGHEVASCRTEHEGRGRCALTPAAGRKYTLKIAEPAGISSTYPLPACKPEGAVLMAVSDTVAANGPARFKVGSTQAGTFTLQVRRQEMEVGSLTLTFGGQGLPVGSMSEVAVRLAPGADGVLAATLWNASNAPLAERLVFRNQLEPLRIKISADQATYQPGGSAALEISTTDLAGHPVSAVVGVTVTDDSVREMQETRDQAPRLAVMALLEPEVRELADAQVYLDPQNPKADMAVDLLLGTQGWRRFALVNIDEFLAAQGEAGRRVFAQRQAPPPPPPPAAWGGRGGMEKEDGAEQDGLARAMAAPAPAPVPPVPPMMAAAAPAPPPGAPPMPQKAAAPPPPRMAINKLRKAAVAAPAARPAPQHAAAKKPAVPQGGEQAKRRGPAQNMLARQEADMAPEANDAWAHVREYAHTVRPGRGAQERSDFAETLYFQAGVRTHPQTGKATVRFGLSDAVTTFRAAVDGYSADGALGGSTLAIQSVTPFYVEPKMPLATTEGDVIALPVALINNTAFALADSVLSITLPAGLKAEGDSTRTLAVPAGGRARELVRIDTQHFVGGGNIKIAASGGNYRDLVSRPLAVEPRGFPLVAASGGVLEPNGKAVVGLSLAPDLQVGSVKTEIVVYPSPMARLTQALERLLQEPSGCFEQTSSTSYPLTMAQQYFTTHANVDAALQQRGSELLARSYQRLVGFECKDKGYEWFGGAAPGHEALTAYGVMQFADMQRAGLRNLDTGMLDRTRQWLLSRRDKKGGFARNQRALDSFGGAPEATTDAYILWALVSAGQTDLKPELARLKERALATQDAYVQALAANVAWQTGDRALGKELGAKLVAQQDAKSGAVHGASTSITRSGGEALQIETTSLALLGWIKDPSFAAAAEAATRYLASVCEGGRFASTQATVLALKAIVAYDQAHAGPKLPGTLELWVDNQRVGEPLAFKAAQDGPIALPNAAGLMTAGKHVVELRMDRGNAMPYSVAVNYHANTPASAAAATLTLDTRLQSPTLREGDTTEIQITAANTGQAAAPMPVAIVGIPGGLEPRHDQLKELVKAGKVAAYEVRGREVVLYWRQLAAGESVTLPVSLVATVPGHYTGPASRIYAYYNDGVKQWVPGLVVDAEPL